jgi:hypothetical protein
LGYFVSLIGLLVIGRIWLTGMETLVTFLGLLSAGIAIALKDPLINIAGWVYILARKPFNVGERIEINNVAGDVIDIRIFQFSILEIGNWVQADQSTGRVLHIPNGVIFNPAGNTDLANAFYVTASGGAIQDEGFGHLGINCFTSTNLGDLSTPSEQYLQAVSDDTWSGDYFPYGLIQGGDAMYAVNTLFFTDGEIGNYSKLAIWKGVLNNDQNDFEWSATVIEPEFVTYIANDGGGDFESLMSSDNRSVAFSPDGSVGYMVVLGSLISYEENLSRPVVFKTNDAGQNWVLQPELDIVNMAVLDPDISGHGHHLHGIAFA